MRRAVLLWFAVTLVLLAQTADKLTNEFKPIYADYDRAVESSGAAAYFANFAAPNYF